MITGEVEFAAIDAEPTVRVLLESPLATVFEIDGDAGIVTCLSGPGAPWGQMVAGRA